MNQTVRLRVSNEIPAYRTGLVSALDVGTSKIVCVIGQAEAGSLKVLGSALRESAGLKAGTVTSLELAEESIRDCVAAAASFAYLADDTVGFIGATAVMHQDLRTGGGECQRAGAADATGGVGDESRFS